MKLFEKLPHPPVWVEKLKMVEIHVIFYSCVQAQNNGWEKKEGTGGKEERYNNGHAGIKGQRKV